MKSIKFILFPILIFISSSSDAAVGCKVIGGNTIYPNYNTFLLGVLINGVNIGVPSNVYTLANPISTMSSCSVPWVDSYQVLGSCVYGTPAVAVPFVVSVCTNCVNGELVDYTTTVQCNLDDYSWALGATVGILGLVFIRRTIVD